MLPLRALRRFLVAATLACSFPVQAQIIAATGTVYLNPEAGNHIAAELDGPTTWMHGTDGIMYGSDHISRASDGVHLFFERGEDLWLLQFVAPAYNPATGDNSGQPLKVGLYDNVQGDWRFEPRNAGMLISSPMGEVWDWSGWFRVREIAYAANGDLARFAVDFRQFDSLYQVGPALTGALRYNSTIAIHDIPEPATVPLMLGGLAGLAGLAQLAKVRPRRRETVSR